MSREKLFALGLLGTIVAIIFVAFLIQVFLDWVPRAPS